jgi:hypothetical protein
MRLQMPLKTVHPCLHGLHNDKEQWLSANWHTPEPFCACFSFLFRRNLFSPAYGRTFLWRLATSTSLWCRNALHAGIPDSLKSSIMQRSACVHTQRPLEHRSCCVLHDSCRVILFLKLANTSILHPLFLLQMKAKIKFSLALINHNAMKMYGGVEV